MFTSKYNVGSNGSFMRDFAGLGNGTTEVYSETRRTTNESNQPMLGSNGYTQSVVVEKVKGRRD